MQFCPLIRNPCKQTKCAFYSYNMGECSIKGRLEDIPRNLSNIEERIKMLTDTIQKSINDVEYQISTINNNPVLGEWNAEQIETIVKLLRSLYPNENTS